MTVPIAPGPARSVSAQAFARELRKAMAVRKASAQRLSEASGCMKSSIGSWRAANNLPQPATAARLAEALDWPRLLAIATEARTKRCPRCGQSYVDATGAGNRQFCSSDCRLVDSQLRKPAPAIALHDAVRAATDARLAGEAERRTLPATLDALHAYEAAARRQRDRVDAQDRRLRALVASVEAMCGGCEPEGLCRTTDCPLRPFSPLPVASDRAVAEIRKPASPHDAEHRDAWLASVRSANEARWSREGERERASETHRALHAAMSPEQREERGRRISAGRRSHMEEATA